MSKFESKFQAFLGWLLWATRAKVKRGTRKAVINEKAIGFRLHSWAWENASCEVQEQFFDRTFAQERTTLVV